MKILYIIIVNLIQRGKIKVEIPGLDMEQLTKALHSEAAQVLREVEAVACTDEMTDAEKIEWIQNRLA